VKGFSSAKVSSQGEWALGEPLGEERGEREKKPKKEEEWFFFIRGEVEEGGEGEATGPE